MLLCPTKLCIREGSIHWPWMCTCFQMVEQAVQLTLAPCVCQTILFYFEAGGQSSLMLLCPTKLCIREGSIHWPWMCTCFQTVEQAVQLTLFVFMVLHDTPPKPSHRVLAAEPRVFVSFSFCSLREKHLLKHLQLFGLFTLLFFTFLPWQLS